MIDSHCHLGLLDQEGELEQALAEARAAGITHLVDVGLDLDSSRQALERAERLSGPGLQIGVAVGWHPHHGRPPMIEEVEELGSLLAQPRAVAVGEIGLDYHWTDRHSTPPEVQKTALHAMLSLAEIHGLPALIHNRESDQDLISALRLHPGLKVVMHCFSGDAEFAAQCVGEGYWLSFAGPLTYPSADSLRQAAAVVPRDRLLVETDSPFLPPQGFRGKRNHPALVRHTAARLALLREMEPAELEQLTAANLLRLLPRLAVL